MMSFGTKLKKLRKQARKSQMQMVAEIDDMFDGQANISQTTLSNLELRAKLPKKETVEILSAYFEVPVSYFYENEETKSSGNNRELVVAYLESLKARFHDADDETMPIFKAKGRTIAP